MLQIHLAGYAAEELVMQARPRRMRIGIGLATLAHTTPGSMPLYSVGCDEDLAVQEVLRIHGEIKAEEIRAAVEKHYVLARESLRAVWDAVRQVARALLKHEEISDTDLMSAIGGLDIYRPVFAVQRLQAGLFTPPSC